MQHLDERRLKLPSTPSKASSPMVLLFATGPEITAACAAAAERERIVLTEVRHLQGACAVLKTRRPIIVVASSKIRWWDRAIVDEHAARVNAVVRWVSENDAWGIGELLHEWASDVVRPCRPGMTAPSAPLTGRRSCRAS
jgi:hypothetical protein